MPTPSVAAKISVFAGERFACVKVQGRATFTASLDFNAALNQLHARGCKHFMVELSDCALMDSTFLGVLAGFGLKVSREARNGAAGRVELRNANARVADLLDNIGVLHLFTTTDGPLPEDETLEACEHQPVEAGRREITKTCLQAHETLCAINPDNVSRFKDVTKFLAEDLAKMSRQP